MTNFEYFKDVILAIDGSVAVVNTTGEVIKCSGLTCDDCAFSSKNSGEHCYKAFIKWLYAEHIEKPILTPEEHKLCEGLAYGYIAKDNTGLIYWYNSEPRKISDDNWSNGGGYCCLNHHKYAKFDFIKWEDEKPWSLEELLQLAVK